MILQDFDRDGSVETGISGAIHLAHSTRTDGGEDFVRAQMLTGLDDHGLPPNAIGEV
jgi:hypothetical protein